MALAEPSAKSLRVVTRANGADLGPATGFLVSEQGTSWLVTNWHVLSGRNAETKTIMPKTGATPDSINIRFHGIALGTFNEVEVPLRDYDGVPVWHEHPVHGHAVDVAALNLTGVGQVVTETATSVTYSTPISFYSYDLNATDPSRIFISVTERLSIIGFLTGEGVAGFPIWTQGFVASEPDLKYRDLPCFLIDSRTREGQSGSPTVFYSTTGQYPSGVGVTTLGAAINTRFMGVYSGRINAKSDIGRVWTPDAIAEVVRGSKRASCL